MKHSEADKYFTKYLKELLKPLGFKRRPRTNNYLLDNGFGELDFSIVTLKQIDVRMEFYFIFASEKVKNIYKLLFGNFAQIYVKQTNLAVAGYFEQAFYYPKDENEVYYYTDKIYDFYIKHYHKKLSSILTLEDQYCFIDDEFEKLNSSMNNGTVCSFLLLAKVVDEANYLSQKKRIFDNPKFYGGGRHVEKMIYFLENTDRVKILNLLNEDMHE